MEKQIICVNYNKIQKNLPIEVVLINPYTSVSKSYNAIWDTGAKRFAISYKVFNELSLTNMKKIKVAGVNSNKVALLSMVDIKLTSKISKIFIEGCYVIVCNLPNGVDMLLGMDIITKGDFLISNFEHTLFSFSVPSQKGVSLRGGEFDTL